MRVVETAKLRQKRTESKDSSSWIFWALRTPGKSPARGHTASARGRPQLQATSAPFTLDALTTMDNAVFVPREHILHAWSSAQHARDDKPSQAALASAPDTAPDCKADSQGAACTSKEACSP
eukprot:scaffold122223_cov18-Tisochrysis_lutea.AAC.3